MPWTKADLVDHKTSLRAGHGQVGLECANTLSGHDGRGARELRGFYESFIVLSRRVQPEYASVREML